MVAASMSEMQSAGGALFGIELYKKERNIGYWLQEEYPVFQSLIVEAGV